MKTITILLSIVLILAMAVPVAAVTPTLQPPDLPDVPDISGSVHVELPEDYWDGYFEANPITITPTEGLTHIDLQPISRPSWWEWLIGKYA